MKRVISLVLTVIMAMSVVAIAPTTASASSNVIYFNFGSTWKASTIKQIYCHIWEIGKNSFYSWQSSSEKCTRVSSTKWSYDVSKLKLSSSKDYCVIFSADSGVQTFDQTMGTECKGDTAKLTGSQIENAVDSEKKAYRCVWTTNSLKYGPHKALSSIGNVIGSKLAPHETGIKVMGDWEYAYYKTTTVNVVTALAKGLKAFGVNTATKLSKVYSYVKSKGGLKSSALKLIKTQLQSAYKKAYSKTSTIKTTKAKPKFNKKQIILINGVNSSLKIKNKNGMKFKWSSSNKYVATVTQKGKVISHHPGKAIIYAKHGKYKLKCYVAVL